MVNVQSARCGRSWAIRGAARPLPAYSLCYIGVVLKKGRVARRISDDRRGEHRRQPCLIHTGELHGQEGGASAQYQYPHQATRSPWTPSCCKHSPLWSGRCDEPHCGCSSAAQRELACITGQISSEGAVWVQDPDAGPAMVGNACAQVNSVTVPRMSVQWTCGIVVQGDYACGGGAPVHHCPSPSHTLAVSMLRGDGKPQLTCGKL